MITHVRIQNFRSFLDAEVDLQPFSLIVGANGSGKSNLLKFLSTISGEIQPATSAGAIAHVHLEQHSGPFKFTKSGWVTHQNGSDYSVSYEYFWKATEQDIEAAAVASPSFRMFIKEIQQWRGKPAG